MQEGVRVTACVCGMFKIAFFSSLGGGAGVEVLCWTFISKNIVGVWKNSLLLGKLPDEGLETSPIKVQSREKTKKVKERGKKPWRWKLNVHDMILYWKSVDIRNI